MSAQRLTRSQIVDGTGWAAGQLFVTVEDMAADCEYNGWANRETWALQLHLTNDHGLYDMTRERVAETLTRFADADYSGWPGFADTDELRAVWLSSTVGEVVKAWFEELTDPDEGLMKAETILEMVRDIGSEYRVDWDAIGAAWIEDAS